MEATEALVIQLRQSVLAVMLAKAGLRPQEEQKSRWGRAVAPRSHRRCTFITGPLLDVDFGELNMLKNGVQQSLIRKEDKT